MHAHKVLTCKVTQHEQLSKPLTSMPELAAPSIVDFAGPSSWPEPPGDLWARLTPRASSSPAVPWGEVPGVLPCDTLALSLFSMLRRAAARVSGVGDVDGCGGCPASCPSGGTASRPWLLTLMAPLGAGCICACCCCAASSGEGMSFRWMVQIL